jgi:hypothetical protein
LPLAVSFSAPFQQYAIFLANVGENPKIKRFAILARFMNIYHNPKLLSSKYISKKGSKRYPIPILKNVPM